MAEKMPPELRAKHFRTIATQLVQRYHIRKDRTADLMSSVRIGYLFKIELAKIYSGQIAQDAFICVRDWAWDQKLRCDEIREIERNGDKKIVSPYWNGNMRVFSELSFKKYTDILMELLSPPRKPLQRRTPVTCL